MSRHEPLHQSKTLRALHAAGSITIAYRNQDFLTTKGPPFKTDMKKSLPVTETILVLVARENMSYLGDLSPTGPISQRHQNQARPFGARRLRRRHQSRRVCEIGYSKSWTVAQSSTAP